MAMTRIVTEQQPMMRLSQLREAAAYRITGPVVGLIAKTGITPNIVTMLGLAITLGAAGVIATGHFLLGGFLVLFAGLFDLMDGALSRAKKQTSRFGAILDSTVDRFSEAALLFGLLVLYAAEHSTMEIFLVFVAMVGAFLVSYIRARAEGLGLSCQVGLFTRAERVIVLALGLLLNQVVIALGVLVVFTYVTVAQRLLYVWQQTRNG